MALVSFPVNASNKGNIHKLLLTFFRNFWLLSFSDLISSDFAQLLLPSHLIKWKTTKKISFHSICFYISLNTNQNELLKKKIILLDILKKVMHEQSDLASLTGHISTDFAEPLSPLLSFFLNAANGTVGFCSMIYSVLNLESWDIQKLTDFRILRSVASNGLCIRYAVASITDILISNIPIHKPVILKCIENNLGSLIFERLGNHKKNKKCILWVKVKNIKIRSRSDKSMKVS